MKIKITLGILLFWFIPFIISAQDVKRKFPDFKLRDGYGETVKPKVLITPNKYTLFLIYAAWGEPCNLTVTALNELRKEWKEKYDIVINVIAADTASSTVNWLKENGDISNSYYDVDKFLIDKFGVKGCPIVVICNSNQEMIYVKQSFFYEEEQINKLINDLKLLD